MKGDQRLAFAVEKWMKQHRAELVRDLKEMIAIRSVAAPGQTGWPLGEGCHQAAMKMLELAQRCGLAAENHDDYCVSILLSGKTGEKELGILGHLDVVPEGEGWRFDPYQAVEQQGYVIGRGSCDNKGPLIMALYVLRCLRELGVPIKSSIRLIAGCDEENGMTDIRHYLQNRQPPAFTLNCDGAWPLSLGEKGRMLVTLRIPLEEKGLLHAEGGEADNMVPARASVLLPHPAEAEKAASLGAEVEQTADGVRIGVRGKTAHSSVPSLGENAILKLLRILDEAGLLSRETERLRRCLTDEEGTGLRIAYADRLSGKTTCVPVQLRTVDGGLEVTLDVRFAITHDPQALQRSLAARCSQLGVEVRVLSIEPPRYTPPDDPVVKLLMEVSRTIVGKQHRPYVSGGGTHSRLFPHSIPFGVGSLRTKSPYGGPHEADEAVCLDQLDVGAKAYAVALVRLDQMIGG